MASIPVLQGPLLKTLKLLLVMILALLLQACDTELYTGLSEREANLMVASLARHGIAADRVLQDDGMMSVTVDEDHFAEAVGLLDQLGLPEQKFSNLGAVFESNSLVSSPVQERAQMIHALSEELSHTVSQIDGVLSARVHVVLPDNDLLERNSTPSSASVFIRYSPTLDVNPLIPKIKTLVANGIEGLAYDSVSVIPVAAEPIQIADGSAPATLSSFLGIAMPASSVSRAAWIFGLLMILALGLGAMLAWLLWHQRRRSPYELETPP